MSKVHQEAIASFADNVAITPMMLAEKLKITDYAVRKLIREGKIIAIHKGRKLQILKDENLVGYERNKSNGDCQKPNQYQ